MSKVKKEFLEEAIKKAEQSKPEREDMQRKKVHPNVGCVIVKNNKIIASGSRNELEDGDHAESTALRSCSKLDLKDAILITTLEPCIYRKHNWLRGEHWMSCVELILHFGIRKVVIGMIDPNPEVRGRGIFALEERGIEVECFPSELRSRIYTINKDYITFHLLNEQEKIIKGILSIYDFILKTKEEFLKYSLSSDQIKMIFNIELELLRREVSKLLL
jgi:pyrimidine deaminase RibD-like protein